MATAFLYGGHWTPCDIYVIILRCDRKRWKKGNEQARIGPAGYWEKSQWAGGHLGRFGPALCKKNYENFETI